MAPLVPAVLCHPAEIGVRLALWLNEIENGKVLFTYLLISSNLLTMAIQYKLNLFHMLFVCLFIIVVSYSYQFLP